MFFFCSTAALCVCFGPATFLFLGITRGMLFGEQLAVEILFARNPRRTAHARYLPLIDALGVNSWSPLVESPTRASYTSR